ncbi:MAG: hypothetical protein IKI49_00005 [Oscillospiraceae bacterium]|nr:hypothetical protein [Oscillospiraceae bacterium]
MEEKKSSGSGFLKVCGILLIIFGALALILSLVGIAGMAALQSIMGSELNVSMAWVALVFAVVGSAIELIAGIIGVANSKKPEKAKTCIVWGALVAAVSVASAILTVASGQDFPIVSLLIGLVLPVLFIIGAVKNMKA